MDLLKGLSQEQQKQVTRELREFAVFKRSCLLQQLNVYPDNLDLYTQVDAWDQVCRNLGVGGTPQ